MGNMRLVVNTLGYAVMKKVIGDLYKNLVIKVLCLRRTETHQKNLDGIIGSYVLGAGQW